MYLKSEPGIFFLSKVLILSFTLSLFSQVSSAANDVSALINPDHCTALKIAQAAKAEANDEDDEDGKKMDKSTDSDEDDEDEDEEESAKKKAAKQKAAPPPVEVKPIEVIPPEQAIEKSRLEVDRKRFGDAKQALKQSIGGNQTNLPLYEELYSVCVKSNDWSDAAFSLEKIIELDPAKEKEVYADYGVTQFKLRRYDRARTILEKALEYGKNLDLVRQTLVKIALVQKDDPEAIKQYREYLKLKPDDGEMHWEFANYLYKLGKIKDSLPEYKLASEKRPMNSYGHERYAYLLLIEKDYAGSIEAYKKAISVSLPKDTSRLNIALKYALQQQKLAGKAK